jgi:hypothetical protein
VPTLSVRVHPARRAQGTPNLLKLRLGAIAQRLDGILSQAARGEPMYLDFLDQILSGRSRNR